MIKNHIHPLLEIPLTYTVFKTPIGLTGLVATPNGLLQVINKMPNENFIEVLLKNLTIGKIKNIPLTALSNMVWYNWPLTAEKKTKKDRHNTRISSNCLIFLNLL